ncbi:type II CRISPR RNA-guided endonuclease Cas9 [Desulfosediminicola sp.]|uniref:type II CRISPR RNA-guided endonuclease Cas9 n=1 Tax=Desulfosediminicola sp. TaxID=2886825 RepID=UPI003AF25BC4
MCKKIIGLDLGTNSIGWAVLGADEEGAPKNIIGLGSRIFTKAVEDKTPTPKNVQRRNARLNRRVVQRRSRRKKRMMNYLLKLDLLPQELRNSHQPEVILNTLGDPYQLRAKALDSQLEKHELGRVLLHLVQRRGFLSNKKTLLGDMVDDPDVLEILQEAEASGDIDANETADETAFKEDIRLLKSRITSSGARTLGEYLSGFPRSLVKRNRLADGGHLRTDRQMYLDEFKLITAKQQQFYAALSDEVIEQLESIIFYQRPLKLNPTRVGKCSLEKKLPRTMRARLEVQRFRYLQDTNNLEYFERHSERWCRLSAEQRQRLITALEAKPSMTYAAIRKLLKLEKSCEFNLEASKKKLTGNITAYKIRTILNEWDKMSSDEHQDLVEDLLTIRKKSVLKKRLINHWQFPPKQAVALCLLEFEAGHASHSLKAIRKLLPFLRKGQIYSEARVNAGYRYQLKDVPPLSRLPLPPDIPNPIVRRALHELRRVVNAIIAKYGKPDAIRIEMARDLEMNTTRYKNFITQQKANEKINEEASKKYRETCSQNPHLALPETPSRADKLKYRLWKEQNGFCAYSLRPINMSTLFSANIEIDHILPYSLSLDNSYINKVVCYAEENRLKGQRTPIDAFGGSKRWEQITQALGTLKNAPSIKKSNFFKTEVDLQERDFINNQLNDTRYIARESQDYVASLGCDVSVSKGVTTAMFRKMWQLNSILSTGDSKQRDDHRHHAIDAAVVACVDRALYVTLVKLIKDKEREREEFDVNRIHLDPPWFTLRNDLSQKVRQIIVSYAPQRKLSGPLHEDTGAGFVPSVGTVYRKNLNGDFKVSNANSIVDPEVRKIILTHLKSYGNNSKNAFSEDITVFHKDGKTPIKRVRVVQAKALRGDPRKDKYGVKDKSGRVFKYMAYGNSHHVEIVQERTSGEYSGKIITNMEAHHRIKGIAQPVSPIINIDHGEKFCYVGSLHINDTVSLAVEGVRSFFVVQKLGQLNQGKQPRPTLRPHTAATGSNYAVTESVKSLMTKYEMRLHSVNAIGEIVR